MASFQIISDEMQDTMNTQRKMVRCTGVIFVNISQMSLFTDRVGRPQDHFDLEKPEHVAARSCSF